MVMRTQLVVLMLVVGLIATVMSLAAHHSFSAEFDINRPTFMDGKVTMVQWGAPHVYVFMDVKDVTDKAGGVVNWSVELSTPADLIDAGWKKDTLRTGMDICVEGFLQKRGEKVLGSSSSLTVLTGKGTNQVLTVQGKMWRVPDYTGKASCSNRNPH